MVKVFDRESNDWIEAVEPPPGYHPFKDGYAHPRDVTHSGESFWRLNATHGVPLEISIGLAWDEHMRIPRWYELALAAKRDGTNMKSFALRVKHIMLDVYPKGMSDDMVERWNELVASSVLFK